MLSLAKQPAIHQTAAAAAVLALVMAPWWWLVMVFNVLMKACVL